MVQKFLYVSLQPECGVQREHKIRGHEYVHETNSNQEIKVNVTHLLKKLME
jgi:hypothetical protein